MFGAKDCSMKVLAKDCGAQKKLWISIAIQACSWSRPSQKRFNSRQGKKKI